jgi:regulator of sigma E protease
VSPVKVTQVGADSVKSGLSDWYLNLFAMLSLNLAIVNLLPLPALDGGRLLFLLAEGVMRRPVPARLEAWVHAVGFVVFFALVLGLMIHESLTWYRGG